MNTTQKVLLAVLVLEIAVGGTISWRLTQRIEPPAPNLDRLDEETAAAIESLREKASDGKPTAWRALAETFLGTGFYAAAEECFRRAHEMNPEDLQAAYGLGFCLERTGKTSEAVTVLTSIAESPACDADLSWTCWYQIGRCHLRQENPVAAESAFLKIPEFAPAAYQLSKLLTRLNRADEALPYIEAQLENSPNDIKFLQIRGKAATALGDVVKAAEMRDREDRAEYIVEMEYGLRFLGPLGAKYGLGSRLSRALTLKSEGSPRQQSAALAAALEIIREKQFWNYRSVFIAMAELEVETGQIDAARSLIGEVRQFSQDGPELLELEGKCFLLEGREGDALSVWQRALKMKPSIELLQELAKLSESETDQNRYRAEQFFRTGLAEFSRNRVEASLPWFEKSTDLDPTNSAVFFYRGDAHRLLGNHSKAQADLAQCLKLKPNHGRAIEHLAVLQH